MLGETMSINKLFAVLDCQPTTPNRLRGEARNGRRATYVGRSRRPDGDLRDKPGCVPASGCTKGAPWRISRCIGPDGSPVGGAQQRRLSPYLVSQEEKPSKSARGAGPPGTRKTRRVERPAPGTPGLLAFCRTPGAKRPCLRVSGALPGVLAGRSPGVLLGAWLLAARGRGQWPGSC